MLYTEKSRRSKEITQHVNKKYKIWEKRSNNIEYRVRESNGELERVIFKEIMAETISFLMKDTHSQSQESQA